VQLAQFELALPASSLEKLQQFAFLAALREGIEPSDAFGRQQWHVILV
jgi:hypothetical protein